MRQTSFSQGTKDGHWEENSQFLIPWGKVTLPGGSFSHKKDSLLCAEDDYDAPMRPVIQHPYLLRAHKASPLCPHAMSSQLFRAHLLTPCRLSSEAETAE